jgi:hypothetical protein
MVQRKHFVDLDNSPNSSADVAVGERFNLATASSSVFFTNASAVFSGGKWWLFADQDHIDLLTGEELDDHGRLAWHNAQSTMLLVDMTARVVC